MRCPCLSVLWTIREWTGIEWSVTSLASPGTPLPSIARNPRSDSVTGINARPDLAVEILNGSTQSQYDLLHITFGSM